MASLIQLREKGQLTLPAEVRADLGLKAGDLLILTHRDDEIVLVRQQSAADPARGLLARFAQYREPDATEESEWIASRIAETADDYDKA